MATYGYVRISTPKQNLERQIRNIKSEYPMAFIVEEKYTGTKMARPAWEKLMKVVKAGDVIVFDSVSRMSRDAEEGFAVYEELYQNGVELMFLKEPQINTQTYKAALQSSVPLTGTTVDFILDGVNKYLLALAKEQIRLSFAQAEKEVQDLHQRTREGIVTARLNGKRIGRAKGEVVKTKKEAEAKNIIFRFSKDFAGSLNDAECIRLAGVSRNTYYKYKAEIKASG